MEPQVEFLRRCTETLSIADDFWPDESGSGFWGVVVDIDSRVAYTVSSRTNNGVIVGCRESVRDFLKEE